MNRLIDGEGVTAHDYMIDACTGGISEQLDRSHEVLEHEALTKQGTDKLATYTTHYALPC